jgi:hypothetical protein
MPIPDTLQHVMTEIGPLLEIEEVVEYPAQSLWTLTIDTGTVVFAEYDEASGQVILSVDVGALPSERRAELHDVLLRYNGRWEDTGGIWMSLDADGEMVQQTALIPAAHLDTRGLHVTLMNFLDVLGHWRQQILGQEVAEGEEPRVNGRSADEKPPPPEFGLRI